MARTTVSKPVFSVRASVFSPAAKRDAHSGELSRLENASAAFLRRKKALSFNAFSSRAFSKLHRRVRQTFHVELIGEHVKQNERHRGDEIAREKSGIAARIGG